MHEFWAYLPVVHVKNTESEPSNISSRVDVLEEILRRSNKKLISLFIWIPTVYIISGLGSVLSLLLDCADRWGVAVLALSCLTLSSNFSTISGRLGKLRSLSIIALDPHLTPPVEHTLLDLTMFKYAPLLRCVYFRGKMRLAVIHWTPCESAEPCRYHQLHREIY